VRGNRVLGGLVLLAIIILVSVPITVELRLRAAARDSAVSSQTVLTLMDERVRAVLTFLFRAREAVVKHDAMLDEVARARHELRHHKTLEQENRLLRRMMGFKESSAHGLLLGRVIARGGTSGWWQSIRINRGSDDGVQPNQAVISVDGLVGKTTTVTRHTSDVLLITDPANRVACRLERTGDLGVTRGLGTGLSGKSDFEMVLAAQPCTMDYVDKDAEILVGDRVVSSGLGGTYPGELLLGTVLEFEKDPSGLYQRLKVRPAADLARLHYVWVVNE
jgi:rod shape-determining protein MreC